MKGLSTSEHAPVELWVSEWSLGPSLLQHTQNERAAKRAKTMADKDTTRIHRYQGWSSLETSLLLGMLLMISSSGPERRKSNRMLAVILMLSFSLRKSLRGVKRRQSCVFDKVRNTTLNFRNHITNWEKFDLPDNFSVNCPQQNPTSICPPTERDKGWNKHIYFRARHFLPPKKITQICKKDCTVVQSVWISEKHCHPVTSTFCFDHILLPPLA